MTHHIRITVEVDVERITGKFASLQAITEAVVDEIDAALNGQTIYPTNTDSDAEYEITSCEWVA